MYPILEKTTLCEGTDTMVVLAPDIAQKAQPGQFVILRADEFSERVPLTVADFDREKGTITAVFQKVGRSTLELGEMRSGDLILDFVGPLGRASEIGNYGTVVCVGGGVGIAPIHPIARALHEAGNRVIAILGARSADRLFWLDEMQAACDDLVICTDDGSMGRNALVTEPLQELLESDVDIAHVWAIGPSIMMKFCCKTTEPYAVPTTVSLDSVMVDGTGMCGACRVEVGGETKFACVDGPEFDGHLVNWDVVLSRKQMFVREETQALQSWHHEHDSDHVCNLDRILAEATAQD